MKTINMTIKEKELGFEMSKNCEVTFGSDGWTKVRGTACDCGKVIRRLRAEGYESGWRTLDGKEIVHVLRNGRTYELEFYFPDASCYFVKRVV